MKTKIWVFALICVPFCSLKAQRKSNDSSTVIIFNSGGSTYKKKKASGESNVIKIAPLGLLTGTFPLLYERSITDFMSIQVGGGLTHRNYFRSAIAGEQDIKYTYPSGFDGYDEAEGIYSFTYRKPEMGYMASLQPRFYFESEGLEGNFLGLSFDYYKYKFNMPGAVNKNGSLEFTGAMKPEFENIRDFMVHFGGQQLYDRLTLEYSTAIGLRSVNGSKYVAVSNNGQTLEGFAPYKQNLINFAIGLKAGYHF